MAKPTYRVVPHPHKEFRCALELTDGDRELRVYGAAGHVVNIEHAREHYYPKIFRNRKEAHSWMKEFMPAFIKRGGM